MIKLYFLRCWKAFQDYKTFKSIYNKSLHYLFQGFQGVHIYFGDIISLRDSIKILSDGVDVHQAVVCHLNTFEIWEEPVKKNVKMLKNTDAPKP